MDADAERQMTGVRPVTPDVRSLAPQTLDAMGQPLVRLLEKLWPVHRAPAGPGIRQTLRVLSAHLGGLSTVSVPSGARVLDGVVPVEWHLRSAFIETPDGGRICDAAVNPLHVVGNSERVDVCVSLEQLQARLQSLPAQPDAIPYVTFRDEGQWGFCLTHEQRARLTPGTYRARIDASHVAGALDFGQLVLPGRSSEEVLVSAGCCHPGMANDGLSGPVVAVALAQWLARRPARRYTYRFVFGAEVLAAAAVLEARRTQPASPVVAAFNLTCVGDERAWSFLPSRSGNSEVDRLAQQVLRHAVGRYDRYDWSDAGGDERLYGAPGVDIPMVSIARSRDRTYPEHHTSLDTLGRVVTARGLAQSVWVHQQVIEALEGYSVAPPW